MHTSPARRSPRFRALRALTVLVGGGVCLGLFVCLVLRFEGRAMLESLRALGQVVPLLLFFEACRAACELIATRALIGPDIVRLPLVRLMRGQLLAQCFDVLLPAGRAAAESSKAILYARDLGWPLAAAIGAALQLAVLAANTLWVVLAYALSTGWELAPAVRTGLVTYAVAISAVVLGIAVFAAAPRVRRWCERLPVVHASLSRFTEILFTARARLGVALGAQLTSRVLQALQLWAAAEALGAAPTLAQAVLTQAVYLVGAALGELVPAQLGTTDAAFVLAAPALGLTALSAFSATLALHAVQVGVALLAGLAAFWVHAWEAKRAGAADAGPRLMTLLGGDGQPSSAHLSPDA